MILDKEGKRFQPKGLDVGEGIRLPHFTPVDGIFDQFGNRLFSSKSKNFWDDASRKRVKAPLLVSPTGQQFIQQHPGVLRDIETGITSLEVSKEAQITPTRAIQSWKGGSQSHALLFTAEDKTVVIKVPRDGGYGQPYVNEMLQSQIVEQEFRDFLVEKNVTMNRFLFASGQMSCTELVDGQDAEPEDINHFVFRLSKELRRFIRENKSNSLWRGGVMPDLIKFFPTTQVRANNFIKKPDGGLVWIDPFFVP